MYRRVLKVRPKLELELELELDLREDILNLIKS